VQTFLWINIITLLPFIALSFVKKVSFYKDFFYVLPAIIIPAAIFIVWEYFFVVWGVWDFNPAYITGIYWFGLPMEEVWSFITSAYSCLCIYAFLKVYIQKDILRGVQKLITTFFLLLSLVLFFAFPKYLYTSLTSLVCIFLLLIHSWIAGPKSLSRFYLAFFICLIPFLIINGILTRLPVISYDARYIIGIKLYTVPIESILYFLALFLMNVVIYEYFKRRKELKIEN
jgi:lycopene cyclase domain-containing protein